MPKIEIRRLSFSYKDGKERIKALDNIELNIEDGEFVCILGPSGCGKSTLLRLIAGLEQPDEGGIYIDGVKIDAPGADRMIVFQDYALFPWLTAEKNISFALRQGKGLTKAEARENARSFLHKVAMGHGAKLYPFQLSGGMKQRVAIARALAMDTDILLLDEPFAALDAKIRREIQELLIELWEKDKKTVLFVTHDVDEALRLADRIVFMEPGRIKAEIPVRLSEDGELKKELMRLFE